MINWGILGCASIAKNAVMPAINDSKNGRLYGVASRNLENANKVAEEFGAERAFGSYEDLLNDPAVDAVYIPLPNHLHREWSIKAMEKGKHVLCEKPIAVSETEAQAMEEVAQREGVQLSEAFMYRYHPRYDRIKEIIESGEIGEIRTIRGAFTFHSEMDSENFRLRKEMGGGSLYDVGCYLISAARFILDEEPEAVTMHALFSPEHDNVDMVVSGLMEFPNNIGVIIDCGMWADFRNSLEILGSKGRIEIPTAFLSSPQEESAFVVTSNGFKRVETTAIVNPFQLEVESFATSIVEGKPAIFPVTDAVRNMRVIDACLKSAKERTRVQVTELKTMPIL